MSTVTEELAPLYPLRCRTCGTIMGYTTRRTNEGRVKDLTQWCSPECSDVPISENPDRDDLMIALHSEGVAIPSLAEIFGISRQGVTQLLDRRTGRGKR
jgi:hypothetical protein